MSLKFSGVTGTLNWKQSYQWFYYICSVICHPVIQLQTIVTIAINDRISVDAILSSDEEHWACKEDNIHLIHLNEVQPQGALQFHIPLIENIWNTIFA